MMRNFYARNVRKNPSIVRQLFIVCITFKTDVAKLQSNQTSFRPVFIAYKHVLKIWHQVMA